MAHINEASNQNLAATRQSEQAAQDLHTMGTRLKAMVMGGRLIMAADARPRRLMSTFLVELEEHARAMERNLLLLERGDEESGPIYVSLFRSAHSLKGAARVTGLHVIETACHRVEEILQALQEGRSVADGPLFQLLLSTADALSATGRLLAEKSDTTGSPLVRLLPKPQRLGARSRLPRACTKSRSSRCPRQGRLQSHRMQPCVSRLVSSMPFWLGGN